MSAAKEVVHSDSSPKPFPVMPFCAAVKSNGFVFCSGNIGMDPVTCKVIDGTVQDRTRQALKNITGVLKDAGSSIENIVKVNVYLTNMSNFQAMNEAYLEFFPGEYLPARTCIAVKELPLNTDVEIECTAHL